MSETKPHLTEMSYYDVSTNRSQVSNFEQVMLITRHWRQFQCPTPRFRSLPFALWLAMTGMIPPSLFCWPHPIHILDGDANCDDT